MSRGFNTRTMAQSDAYYHTTEDLLTRIKVLGHSCVGTTLKTDVVNHTAGSPPLPLALALVNADRPQKHAAANKLRVMLTFGVHGREYFASEVAHKCASGLR